MQTIFSTPTLRRVRAGALAFTLTALALLSACGGGNNIPLDLTSSQRVVVFGDSLVDTGTFDGVRPTVNAAGVGGAVTPIWADLVAARYSQKLCSFYRASSAGSFSAPNTACNNYGLNRGRINSLANTEGPTSPYSITNQMQTAAQNVRYQPQDLVLVDGGGNDAADLFTAFLGATTDPVPYQNMLQSLLTPAEINAALAQPNGAALAGGLYMKKLADKMAASVKTQVLEKGAEKVAILNAPDITQTPRFKLVLSVVQARSNAEIAGMFKQVAGAWVSAYNAQLQSNFTSNSKVLIVDFFNALNTQIANPGQYGLSNVNTPACPATGAESTGLPSYNFATCTAAALDASGPAGWRNYAFSDGFHPTPRGHELLATVVNDALKAKGWQ